MAETFAAIEMTKGETPHRTVHRFMQAATDQKLLFHNLEVMDVFTIGTRRFVRFRVDHSDIEGITQGMRKDRAVIIPNGGGGYKICLPGGREAPVASVKMHMTALSNYKRTYRGPKSKLWEAQFAN